MIDLSNNNGKVNFITVRAHHQYRVYLKRSEGTGFTDPTFEGLQRDALRAGLRVGAYHFARPSQNTPREEADFFLRLAPELKAGHSLRHCLDLEDPNAKASPRIGAWAVEWLAYVQHHVKYHAIIYGSPYYLMGCAFHRPPALLWLAAYGRNNGHEYPYTIPKPWGSHDVVAHQYASTAHVPGCEGQVDISHVLRPRLIDVNRLRSRR